MRCPATNDLLSMAFVSAVATMSAGCEVQMAGRGPVPVPVYRAASVSQTRYSPPPPGPPRPSPQPAAEDCIDPGDRDLSERYDQATVIEPQSTTVGCTFGDDVDMFVTTAPPGAAGSLIHFSLGGQTKLTPIMDVLNANRARLGRVVGPRSGEARGWVHVAGGTPVFLRVSQSGGEREAYHLVLTVEAVPEPGEPNNDMEHATLLREGKPAVGFFGGAANDTTVANDWYRVESAHDGPLKVDLDTSEGVYPMITIVDANRRELARVTGNASERIQAVATVHHGITYIKINSWHGMELSGEGERAPWLVRPYTLSVAR